MSRLERRLAQDKAMRDTALRLFKADLTLVREDLQQRSIGGRLADRMGDGAMDLALDAVEYAEENRGKVAAGVAATVLFFAGGPLLRMLDDALSDDDPDAEQCEDSDRSSGE